MNLQKKTVFRKDVFEEIWPPLEARVTKDGRNVWLPSYTNYRRILNAHSPLVRRCSALDVLYSPDIGPPFSSRERAGRASAAAFRDFLLEIGFPVSTSVTNEAWADWAEDLELRNCFESEFSRFTWDGTPRIDRLFIDRLGAPDEPLYQVYARVWWLRTVFRWLHPIGDDYANPNVPVLHGAGGLGKTTFCRDISGTFPERAPDTIFFLKTQIGGETKSVFEKFKGKLVVEYEELVVNGSDAARKAFTGGGSQTFREAYARSAKVHHVIAAQIGTTNEHKFIQSNDVENERRFLPVLVTKKYMENRIKYDEWKQLVAEAMVAINDCVPPMDITMFERDIVESHRKNVDSCRSVKVLRQESDEELREENLAVYRQFYLNYLRNLWFAPHGNGGPPKHRSKVRVADLRKAAMDEFKTNTIAPCATALRGTPGIVVKKCPEFSAVYVVPEDGERPPWTYPDGTHGAEVE